MSAELRRRLREAAGPPATIGLTDIRTRAAHKRRMRKARLGVSAAAVGVVVVGLGMSAIARWPSVGFNSAAERVDASDTAAAPDGDLFDAIHADDPVLTAAHLAAGADPNEIGPFGATPLAAAVIRSDPDLVGLLLGAGADPSTPMVTGWSPVHLAAAEGDDEIVELLLADHPHLVGLPLDYQTGSTPLMVAADAPHPETVATLIALGAAVNAVNDLGLTSLHIAIADGKDPESVRLLLAAGADPDLVTTPGLPTARELASDSAIPEIRDLLT